MPFLCVVCQPACGATGAALMRAFWHSCGVAERRNGYCTTLGCVGVRVTALFTKRHRRGYARKKDDKVEATSFATERKYDACRENRRFIFELAHASLNLKAMRR